MKLRKHNARKVHRNFKLPQDLNQTLVAMAEKTHRTQTAVIEIALKRLFATKPQEWIAACIVLAFFVAYHRNHSPALLAALPLVPLPSCAERFYAWCRRHIIELAVTAGALWVIGACL